MKFGMIATFSAAAIAASCSLFSNSADACFFPFWPGSWGGYGYSNPAPVYTAGYGGGYGSAYGGYGGAYSAYSPGWSTSMSPSYYGASYASGNGCCVPSNCDPCGNSCVSGSCGTNSCVGTTGDSLKPAVDPNFEKKKDDLPDPLLEDPLLNDRNRPNRDPQEFPPRRAPSDTYEPSRDPLDSFSTPSPSRDLRQPEERNWSPSERRGSDPLNSSDPGRSTAPADSTTSPPAGSPGTFSQPEEDDGLFPAFDSPDPQSSNKPPMTDPLDSDDAAAPADGSVPAGDRSAPDGTTNPDASAPTSDDFLSPIGDRRTDFPFGSLSQSSAVFAERHGSQLREVVPSLRLAVQRTSTPPSQFATSKQSPQQPLRWISVPRPAGHAQL